MSPRPSGRRRVRDGARLRGRCISSAPPMLDRRERLPGPQRDALATAFGLSAAPAPDRFCRRSGRARPVLRGGRGAAARLRRRRRPMVGQDVGPGTRVRRAPAARGIGRHGVRGARAHRNAGVGRASRAGGRRARRRRMPARCWTRRSPDGWTSGCATDRRRGTREPARAPGAAAGLTPAELAGGFGLPDAVPADEPDRAELPPPARVAARRDADACCSWRRPSRSATWPCCGARPAARARSRRAAAPAQAAGLIELGARVRFRHPLVRSAIYRAASLPERQQVHRALAEATDPDARSRSARLASRPRGRRGPTRTVAASWSARPSGRGGRGGIAASAAFLERAAELTPDPARRGRAGARRRAGQAGCRRARSRRSALLAIAELTPLDELQRARLQRLRAQIAFARRRGSDAPPLLLDAAKRLVPLDPDWRARRASKRWRRRSSPAAAATGGTCSRSPRRASDGARPPAGDRPAPATVWRRGSQRATRPACRRCGRRSRPSGKTTGTIRPTTAGSGWRAASPRICGTTRSGTSWPPRGVRRARETGALSVLPIAASYRAGVHVHAGEYAAASALLEEADAITQATHTAPLIQAKQMLAAWRGNEAEALELIDAGRHDATARGQGMALSMIECADALLRNGLGRYEEALRRGGASMRARRPLRCTPWRWPSSSRQRYAAASRTVAAAALERLSERTRASGTDWALGIEARSRALLTDGPSAESLYKRLSSGWRTVASLRTWPAPSSSTANGCAARTGASTRASNFEPPTTRSAASEPRRSPSAPVASSRDRRDRAQAHRRHARRPYAAGGADRPSRPRRSHQPRDRRTTLHQPPNGAVPPPQGLRKAPHHLTQPARPPSSRPPQPGVADLAFAG